MDWTVLHGVQRLSEAAAGALVAGLWQGPVLAAAIAICLRMLPRTGAATRFALWMAAFGVLAVLPLAALYPARATAGGILSNGSLVHADVRWSFVLAALWLTISLYRAVVLAVNGWKLRGLWRRATPVASREDLSSLLTRGRRQVQLCVSDELERPSLIGFLAPRIVVPGWLFERLTDIELRQIVMHEMEHLRRGDDWVNLLQKLGLVLFPLNPVLVWIERRLCLERELACDDGVIRATGAPKAYATCLTTLAERSLDRRVAALTLGAWEKRSQLAERVYRILRRDERMLSPRQAGAVMVLSISGLLAGAVGLSRAPQLISFSPAVLVMAQQAEQYGAPQGRIGAGVPNAAMQNVVYKDGAGGTTMLPHQTLLKASMDDGANATATPVRRCRAKQTSKVSGAAAAKATTSANRLRAAKAPRLFVMSSWRSMDSGEDALEPAMTLTFVEGSDSVPTATRASFAAVPTPTGWLIFKL